jgi:hypothetical protein
MIKKFSILMLTLCIFTLGITTAVQTGSLDQCNTKNSSKYGSLENHQSSHDFTADFNKTAFKNAEQPINKLNNCIVMDPVVLSLGDNVQIDASLTNNQSSKGISKQKISFYSPDGNILDEAKTNGKATYNYPIVQKLDKYSLKAFYDVSSLYYPTDSLNPLEVNRWNLTIHVDDINCKYGDIVPITVNLINSTNKAPIVGKMVNLRLGNGTFITQGKTNDNGQFICNYTVSNCPGENLMEATFNKDQEYNYKVYYFDLNVNKSESKLSVSDMACTRGNLCKLKANLTTETDKPLPNETITFYKNGTKIGENTTDITGQVSYSYICDDIGGNYPITAKYSGNDYYSSMNSVLQLHVYNWKTILKIDNITAKPGEIVTVKAKLTQGLTGEPLANKEVDFNDYNSDFIGTNMTNDDGEAQINYQLPPQPKTYRVSAHFNAEKEYSCSDIAAYIFATDNTSPYKFNILSNQNIWC